MKSKYWIHSVEPEDYNDNGDLAKGVISTYGHGECIVVHGSNEVLTERLIKILEGLNKEAGVEI